jgi:hypothetical protein
MSLSVSTSRPSRSRAALLLTVLLAWPADAGPYQALIQAQDADAAAEALAARGRDIASANDRARLQALERTDQVLDTLAASLASPVLRTVPTEFGGTAPVFAMGPFASIPDATLAASNARVLAAAARR